MQQSSNNYPRTLKNLVDIRPMIALFFGQISLTIRLWLRSVSLDPTMGGTS
jgi:hypothetical protein